MGSTASAETSPLQGDENDDLVRGILSHRPDSMSYPLHPGVDPRTSFDHVLLGAAMTLAGLGLVMVASASITIADSALNSPLYFLWKQLAVLLIGCGVGYFAARVGLEIWHRLGGYLLVIGALMLLAVFIPGVGREVNGSTRWINFGPISLQPSEFMKLFVVVYLSGYLVRRVEEVRSVVSGFFKPVAVLVLIAALLLSEPDYGATVVLFATALGMLFLAGVPWLSFFGWVGFIGLGLAALALAAPYRVARLTSFLNPWADPFDSGFQLTQALIAIGRGEWFGVGLGGSVQKLFYLPEAHTDFLFAVLGEELGFVGMTIVIVLFTVLVWRAFRIAARAERVGLHFGGHLAHGLGITIGLQAFINIGVNLGVLPTKGLALPLLSHGANSLFVNCLSIALLLRVDYETRRAELRNHVLPESDETVPDDRGPDQLQFEPVRNNDLDPSRNESLGQRMESHP